MLLVVSDTSPIRSLGHLDLLHLLGALYTQVLLPPAVESELHRTPSGVRRLELRSYKFIEVRGPVDQAKVQSLAQSLDPGEAEALALALEVKADAILIDEAAGREKAKQLGLIPIGVLGTLVRAKERGLIAGIASLVTRLELELDFRISPTLRAEVLKAAGE